MGLQQVGQLQQQALAVGRALLRPAPIEGAAGGGHRQVHIGLAGHGDSGQFLPGGRVVHRHLGAGQRGAGLAVDQQAVAGLDKGRHTGVKGNAHLDSSSRSATVATGYLG
ncbi:hypothetical protein D3C76_1130970 [compost metagenome]